MTESSAAEPDIAPASDTAERRSDRRERRPRERREWRDGGSSVARWGWELIGWSVLALGAGLIASAALATLVGGELGSLLARAATWVSFAAAIALAFARSRPRGLLRFHPVDLLYGVVLGCALRLAQGWIDLADGGNGAWPSYPSLAGQLPPGWWFDELLTGVVIAPLLEELFFRAVVLVAVYTAVRRLAGRAMAAVTATLASIGLFVLAHAVLAPMGVGAAASLALVALVTSVLVLTTGRVGGALVTHIVYNATWVALATVGTLLSA